jgi:hypothetical protein
LEGGEVLTEGEIEALEVACRKVPLTDNTYLATDLVSTLLDTVIDYQQHTTTVRNAIAHYEAPSLARSSNAVGPRIVIAGIRRRQGRQH